MNIQFPLRLVQQGPGYYLVDDAGRTVAAMTADKADAEFILHACNARGDLLAANEDTLRSEVAETSPSQARKGNREHDDRSD